MVRSLLMSPAEAMRCEFVPLSSPAKTPESKNSGRGGEPLQPAALLSSRLADEEIKHFCWQSHRRLNSAEACVAWKHLQRGASRPIFPARAQSTVPSLYGRFPIRPKAASLDLQARTFSTHSVSLAFLLFISLSLPRDRRPPPHSPAGD